jgi:hypothetical protein
VEKKSRGGLMGALVLLVALSIGGVYAYKAVQPREGKVRGSIAAIDVSARTAMLDVIHPKTGVAFQVSGTVQDDCRVELDGAPVGLEQLRVGDTVEVRGLMSRLTGSMEATEVRAKRRPSAAGGGSAASQPASAPAGGE